MLDKQVTTSGKIFTKISNLKVWDKNPRRVDNEEDHLRLRRQIANLGQYKPLLVTEDGITVGGNMRLGDMGFLNTNIFTYTDPEGNDITIDLRGKFDDVWITELSFGMEEKPAGDTSAPDKFRALIDGKVQDRIYDSVEQIMIEYALSDNDAIGMYDQQALGELVSPYQKLIPMPDYKLELAPHVSLKTFVSEFKTNQPPALGNGTSEIDKEKVKKELNIVCPKCGFQLKGDSGKIEDLGSENEQL